MKHLWMIVALVCLLVPCTAQHTQPVIWPAEHGIRLDAAVGGRLKVRLSPWVPRDQHARILKELGCTILYAVLPWEQSLTSRQSAKDDAPLERENTSAFTNILRLEELLLRTYVVSYASPLPPEKMAASLHPGCSDIDVAEPCYVAQTVGMPDDPRVAEQEMLRTIRAFDAWDVEGGSAAVTIGISDSGVLQDHEDLAPQLFEREGEVPDNGIDDDGNGYIDDHRGYNFCTADDGTPPGNTYNSKEGHGTGVAGICAAAVNNGIGIAGVAGACTIVPLKTMPENIPGIVYGYESIMYCALNGIKVVNCSWGGYGASCINETIIDYAIARDVAIVAAAGNHGQPTPFYPGSYHGVLNVGVTDPDDGVVSMTGHGPTVDIMAPGQRTLTTSNDGTYGGFCCTSGSSPIVAGVVGLVRSRFPQLTGRQACAVVKTTATPSPWTSIPASIDERLLPMGRVDARAALDGPTSGADLEVRRLAIDVRGDSRWTVGDTVYLRPVIENTLQDVVVDRMEVGTLVWPTPLIPVEVVSAWQTELSDTVVVGDSTVLPSIDVVVQAETDATAFIPLHLTTKAIDGRLDSVRITIPVTPSPQYRTLRNNALTMSAGDRGRLGYADVGLGQGVGLTYRQFCGQLYESGLMISVGDRLVDAVRAERGTNDHFRPLKRFTRPDSLTSIVFDADAPDSLRVGCEVEQRLWMASGDTAVLIVDVTITNKSDSTWRDLAMGYFSDWDLGRNASQNRVYLQSARADSAVQIAASIHPDEPIVALAVTSPYSDAQAICVGMDNTATYRGFSTEAKAAALRSGVQQYDDVNDIATITGMRFKGPIPPGARRHYRMVIAMDTDRERVEQLLDGRSSWAPFAAADTLWRERSLGGLGLVYPNPASETIIVPIPASITFDSNEGTSGFAQISLQIVDLQGRVVIEHPQRIEHLHRDQLAMVDVRSLPQGLYYLRIRSDAEGRTFYSTRSTPVVVLR